MKPEKLSSGWWPERWHGAFACLFTERITVESLPELSLTGLPLPAVWFFSYFLLAQCISLRQFDVGY